MTDVPPRRPASRGAEGFEAAGGEANGDALGPPAPKPAAGLRGGLMKAGLSYGAAQVGHRAIAFLLIPIYTRALTPSEYGVVYFAETLAAIAGAFATLMLPAAIVRMYHQYKGDDAWTFVSSLVYGAMGTGALTAGIIGLGAILSGYSEVFGVPLWPIVAVALGHAVFTQLAEIPLSFLQAQQRPAAYALLSTATALTTACIVLPLVTVAAWGPLGMLIGKLVGGFLGFSVGLILLRRALAARPRWSMWSRAVRFSAPLVPHSISSWLIVGADRLTLAAYGTPRDVGLYSFVFALASVAAMFTNAAALSWSPVFYRLADGGAEERAEAGRIATQLAGLLTAVVLLGMAVGEPFVRLVIDHRYHEGAHLIALLLLGQLYYAFFAVLQLGVLQSGRPGLMAMVTMGAGLTNLGLNVLLVPHYGPLGAAAATVATRGLQALFVYALFVRLSQVPLRPLPFVGCALLAAAPACIAIGADQSGGLLTALAALVGLCAVLLTVARRPLVQLVAVVRARLP